MPKSSPTFAARAAGLLVGLAAGRRLALVGAPDGGLALARILAEELASGRRDLRELARRWVAQLRAHPLGIDSETSAALAHLALHDAPPARAAGMGSDVLVRTVPVALAAWSAPATLVSATYHIAALTHPEPAVAWSAVAVNVALARFLRGGRDFVPEVIDALRNNAVPDALLAAVRQVPLPAAAGPRGQSVTAGDALPDAIADAETALRLAYHEPRFERGLEGLADGPAAAARAGLAGALLGARDGVAAIPAAWTEPQERRTFETIAARFVPAPAPG